MIDSSQFNILFNGLIVTLELSLYSSIGALLIGLLVGLCRVSPIPSLRIFARIYIEFVRSLPVVIILVFIFFAGPSFGISLSSFSASVAGLAIYMASYLAEALRSGINSIPDGQADAARALGFGYMQVIRFVIIPQALRSVVPPIGNVIVDLTKNTSVAYTIAAVELTGAATNLATITARPYLFFMIAIALYLLITLSLGYFFRATERAVRFER